MIVLKVAAALLASVIALLAGALVLGAYLPDLPKAGVIGPVLVGQYPFHTAIFALAGLALSAPAWRGGLVRWGRTTAAITALSAVAALVVAGIQYGAAARAGTAVSLGDVFGELTYPDAVPDTTQTYATRDGRALNVDVYLPKARTGTPAIVLAHGGGFHTFDKSDLRGTGRWLADHGVAVFAADYRLAAPGRPTWDQAPLDLASALRWVQDHARQYGLDRSRISLGGMSAGGVLALNTAYRLRNGTLQMPGRPEPPASVAGFYTGGDVVQMWQRNVDGSRTAAELFTGGTPQQFPHRYREVSPVTQIRPGLQPTLLVVGDRDRSATPRQNRDLGQALRAAGTDVTVEVLPFAVHAFDDAYGSLSSQTGRQILLGFLTRDGGRPPQAGQAGRPRAWTPPSTRR
ncbi:alpha/beta hydrolase [Nonomuraea typhae]|uniref:alpha/beta hydrolase n=1 Tax=Nonomuraea typhae TaxID=2603600 RepID=UPI0012FC0F5E|nr:alpha/beta hydrolase [Nonomuraea typhae]